MARIPAFFDIGQFRGSCGSFEGCGSSLMPLRLRLTSCKDSSDGVCDVASATSFSECRAMVTGRSHEWFANEKLMLVIKVTCSPVPGWEDIQDLVKSSSYRVLSSCEVPRGLLRSEAAPLRHSSKESFHPDITWQPVRGCWLVAWVTSLLMVFLRTRYPEEFSGSSPRLERTKGQAIRMPPFPVYARHPRRRAKDRGGLPRMLGDWCKGVKIVQATWV